MITIDYCKQFLISHKNIFEKTLKKNFIDIYNFIIQNTQFLDDTYKFSDRKYCIINDIKNLPSCIICGKPTRLYRKCCSDECVKIYNKSPECISKKIEKTKLLHGNDCFKAKKSELNTLKVKNPKLYKQLMDIDWLPLDASYSERNWCLNHNITSQPLCKICGKPTHYIQGYGYTQTCCEVCDYKLKSTILQNKTQEEWDIITTKRNETITPIIKEQAKLKRIQTCLQKYNGNAPACDKNIQEKMKQTCIQRYGVDNIFKNSEYIKQKTLEKYGIDNIFKNSVYIKQKQIDKFGCVISQKHLPLSTIEIINDKTKFIDYIKTHNILSISELCDKLSISDFCALKYVKLYNQTQLINRNISHYEDDITNWLKSFGLNVINNKRILNKKEIDIFLPDYNIGIEFNGNYWHSQIFRDPNYHQQKSLLAKQHNIFLYHIFEYEWLVKQDKIKQHLCNLLKLNLKQIYANECKIDIIDKDICDSFLNKYDLNDKDDSEIKLGLFYENNLIMVMTFNKFKDNKLYNWELLKICTKPGLNIIDGELILFQYFIQQFNPHSIIAYCDFSKNNGNKFNLLNFKYVGLTTPNYVLCNNMRIINEKNLVKNIEINNQIFYKIYDCGNSIWEWKQ